MPFCVYRYVLVVQQTVDQQRYETILQIETTEIAVCSALYLIVFGVFNLDLTRQNLGLT